MTITIEQIKQLLDSGGLKPSTNDVVESGKLILANGNSVDYQLHHGWDIAKAYSCDRKWNEFNLKLLQFIKNQNYDDEALAKVLEKIQIDDSHWRWFEKARAFSTTNYDWFFLMADQCPQGACVMFHPKDSAIEKGDIFYIEYIAAAPWNRENPMADQVYKGVGSIMIKHAQNYAHNKLKLRHGFCLHALPRSRGFYQKIGMIHHKPLDKDTLQYFEMPEQIALKFAGA